VSISEDSLKKRGLVKKMVNKGACPFAIGNAAGGRARWCNEENSKAKGAQIRQDLKGGVFCKLRGRESKGMDRWEEGLLKGREGIRPKRKLFWCGCLVLSSCAEILVLPSGLLETEGLPKKKVE